MKKLLVWLWGGLGLLIVMPAAAEWLVMRDGTRIETKGPWEVRGRQVVFTLPGGTLSALRVSEVDLEASEAANREVTEPKSEAQEASPETRRPRKSVLVLTDDDLTPDADPDTDEELEDDEDPAPEPAPEGPIQVVSWDSRESDGVDGLEIVGSIRNTSDDIVARIRVEMSVEDEETGEPLKVRAFLQQASLAPGGRTTFRTVLPRIYNPPENPSFSISSEALTLQGSPRPESDDAEDDLAEDFASEDDGEDFDGGEDELASEGESEDDFEEGDDFDFEDDGEDDFDEGVDDFEAEDEPPPR